MKLLSIVAITGGFTASAVTATDMNTNSNNDNTDTDKAIRQSSQLLLPSITQNRRLIDTMTTEELQDTTQQFVNDNIDSIQMLPMGSRKKHRDAGTAGQSRKNQLTSNKEQHRRAQLRTGRRKKFGHKLNLNLGWDNGWAKSGDWDDDWGGGGWGKSGKSGGKNGGGGWGQGGSDWHSKGGWSGSGKSGKDDWHSGGGWDGFDFGLSRSKWGDDWGGSHDDWGSSSRKFDFHLGNIRRRDLFHILPAACPGECVSSYTKDDYELKDSLKECRENEWNQLWLVRSDGSFVMIESVDEPGKCIAVDYDYGDSDLMVAKTCFNGDLVLRDCHHDYGTEWYFTGGQLVNSMCWAAGLSSVMTILFEDKKELVRECKKDLAVWGAVGEALLKADTFMFVNRLPETEVILPDVDKILGGKPPKKSNDDRRLDSDSSDDQ